MINNTNWKQSTAGNLCPQLTNDNNYFQKQNALLFIIFNAYFLGFRIDFFPQ